jgi:hypothetical protein
MEIDVPLIRLNEGHAATGSMLAVASKSQSRTRVGF